MNMKRIVIGFFILFIVLCIYGLFSGNSSGIGVFIEP